MKPDRRGDRPTALTLPRRGSLHPAGREERERGKIGEQPTCAIVFDFQDEGDQAVESMSQDVAKDKVEKKQGENAGRGRGSAVHDGSGGECDVLI